MAIDFGYFTLSDNYYPNNPRSANDFVMEIREQAILADKLGYSSAWIGEHHFDRLGVNSRPDILLASIIPETENIRLAPAVNVLPIHHPIHVAEMWATLDLLSGGRVDYACGRGYDADEYHPFGADFMTSAEVFEEGMDVLWKAWTEKGPWSHKGKYYAASMVYGGLDKAVDSYRENCVKAGNKPGRAMCSYFIHISDTPEEDDFGRQAMMDYFQHCVLRAFPDDPSKMPPTMHYFMKINEILRNMKKNTLSANSVLLGNSAEITEQLKAVEAAGIDECILYFNVGNKPHGMVKDQMHKFMEEVAPNFENYSIAAE